MNTILRQIKRAAIAVSVISIAACAPGASTPSSAAPPSSTVASPTVEPGSTSAPSADGSSSAIPTFDADTFVVTVSDDIRVRSLPEVSEASKQFIPLLPLGTRLFVVAGPVSTSGFDWYLVAPKGEGLPSGWVAAGRPGDPWIGATTEACPAQPAGVTDLGAALHADPVLAMSCVGGSAFTFDALLGSYEAQCGIEPCCDVVDRRGCINDAWVIAPSTRFDDATALPIVFDGIDPADLPMYTFDEPIRVRATGRLDHPFASGCLPDPRGSDPELIPELGVLRCRTKFVVTSVTTS